MATIARQLVRTWGWIFRAFTIAALSYIGYLWADPGVSIANTPLAALTLKDIFGNLLAAGIVLGGLLWFFNFPSAPLREDNDFAEDVSPGDRDPYVVWGRTGGYLIGLIVFIYAFFIYRS